ncbi:MAG: putative metal-binding motif-containing protein [Myxococcales bacterium]|nr:putative metal-binding motif-containing protein [Myxococcales bacterium]
MTALLAMMGCGVQGSPALCSSYDMHFVYEDHDGDGFGSGVGVGWVCTPGVGQSTNDADCDDTHPRIHPHMAERCDLVDNDCDGVVDETFAKLPWYADRDGDGFGDPRSQTPPLCRAPEPEFIPLAGDCNDAESSVFPGAVEVCNSYRDDDCDGLADDADPDVDTTTFVSWHVDYDGDGFGSSQFWVRRCNPPSPTSVADNTDCNDASDTIYPGAPEDCDGVDNDCDTLVDDEDDSVNPESQLPLYVDQDGDGYGNGALPLFACEAVPGVSSHVGGDCDDKDPAVNVFRSWYFDADGDGYGVGDAMAFSCLRPPDAAAATGDCDDVDPRAHPNAVEICDSGADDDCDGLVDCADPDCTEQSVCVLPCADRVIELGDALFSDSTVGAGDDALGSCALDGQGEDLSIQWVAPSTGTYELSTEGSGFDTVLYVLDGCGGQEVVCNDDHDKVEQSLVALEAQEGAVYLIVVDGRASGGGSFELSVQ